MRRVKLGLPTVDSLNVCFVPRQTADALKSAYVAVAKSLCEEVDGFEHKHERQLIPCGYCLVRCGLFDPANVERLRTLWDAIDNAIEAAYGNGKETGTDLIKGLSSGSVSVKDFNEETAPEICHDR